MNSTVILSSTVLLQLVSYGTKTTVGGPSFETPMVGNLQTQYYSRRTQTTAYPAALEKERGESLAKFYLRLPSVSYTGLLVTYGWSLRSCGECAISPVLVLTIWVRLPVKIRGTS